MKIQRISKNSEYLPRVIDLWRKNSRTLGFFPEGAFDEHAAKQCILIACGDQGSLLGYLLFRIVKRGKSWPQATIVHLCVAEEHRGRGIAKELVNALRDLTGNRFHSITLSCRRDYAANTLWPKLGFKYVDEKVGRSGNPVITWNMDLRSLPLITLLQQKETEGRLRAVIDANILYRLQDPISTDCSAGRSLSEEAKALEEDWLATDLVLFVTDETFNEIQRQDDSTERASRFKFAQQYRNLMTELEDVDRIDLALRPIFPENPTDSTISDIRQLAHAIAGDAHFFITQDDGIRRKSDEILEEFDIRVLSPGELIVHIDEMIRETEYYPERLAGSRIMKSKMSSNQVALSYTHFGCPQQQEKKRQLEKRIREFLAKTDMYEVLLSQQDGTPLSLIVYDRSYPDELAIPVLRASQSSLSSTILRYLLLQAVLVSAREGRVITRVADDYFQAEAKPALEELGFSRVGEQWIKINLAVADASGNLLEHLNRLGDQFDYARSMAQNIASILSQAIQEQDVFMLSDIERRLWPAKILDAGIPTFIVSIAPIWAQHLFDEEIAKGTLWGAREELALGVENVYYRSKRNSRGISSPARILWYVTHDRKVPASKHVRACSSLDEVVIDKPKPLFRRFQRLGVYGWQDVFRTAKNDLEQEVMALRFSNTKLFHNPISLEQLEKILQSAEGTHPVLQSPQLISPKSFARIYTTGNPVS